MNRYSRQTILPEIGTNGQKLLSNAKVLCVGAGGLGSPALLYLSAAGIGTIGIIDGDKVSESNLHRQILFTDEDIGKSKACTAAEKLKKQNPYLDVIAHDFYITADNAEEMIRQYDVIIDGTDNFSAKYILNDICVKFSKPLVYGSISQFEGRVAVFHPDHGACYRCLYPTSPKANVQNCAEAGILGAVAGVIGTLQALETIKTILKLQPLFSKMLIFEFATLETTTLTVEKYATCICSGEKQKIKANDINLSCSLGSDMPLNELRLNSNDYCLIDVRELDEWNNGHIKNAIHWPLSKFERGVFPQELLNTPTKAILYCQGGTRSMRALSELLSKGIHGVRHLKGGFQEWIS